jgi:hypothetical protein
VVERGHRSLEGGEQWKAHNGGPMPAPAGQAVQVRYRNGLIVDVEKAEQRRWNSWGEELGESDWDIVAWRPNPAKRDAR